jgi:ubiquinone/menaquinone biosynthesis C-methylase UbiE
VAVGRVLELGVGSGLNLPLYDPARVTGLVGVDPAEPMLARARPHLAELGFPVELRAAPAEDAGLAARSFDTVVVTYSLCTIPDAAAALVEARRALKPGGRLLFCEHGAAPDPGVARWQRRIEPVWKRLGGGCHLTRDVAALLDTAGWRIEALDRFYLDKAPRPFGFHYLGSARAA